MSALVKQIIVEARGNTAHVEAAIKQLKGELQGLKTETSTAGSAGKGMGDRYAQASVQIAGAAENMARAGKATGEASKMILNQGAQMAFMFGTKGPIVGAIAITTLAIVEMFSGVKKEAETAAAAADKAFSDMARSGSIATISAQVQQLYSGDRYATAAQKKADPKLLGIAELRRRVSDQGAFLAGRDAQGNDTFVGIEEATKALKELEAEYVRYSALLSEVTAKTVEEGRIGIKIAADKDRATKAAADAAEAEKTRIETAIEQVNAETASRKKAYADQTAAATEAANQYYETTGRISDAVAVELARGTKTLVDDIAAKWNQWIADAEKVGNTGLAESLKAQRDAAITAQQAIEDLDQAVRELGLDFKDVANAGKSSLDPKDFFQLADNIERAARGGIQLAEAMGMVDANTSKSLQAIVQIAASLPALKAASDAGKWGGATGILTSALPVVGGIATVVDAFLGAAKAAREHAEALREAREKLLMTLSDRIGTTGQTDAQRQAADIAAQRKADLNSMLDLLSQSGVKFDRSTFLSMDAANQRKSLEMNLATATNPGQREALRAALEQFDLITKAAEEAAAAMAKELEEKRKGIDESLAERRLRLEGKNDEADAVALLARHEAELAAARKEGIYTAEQLAELEKIQIEERKKAAEEAQKRREEEDRAKAQSAQRQKEDLQTRINAANGETPEERARRREIEKRREIEDAMAAGADAATIALIQFAQAAEDAAAAAEAMAQAQREMEDLDVRILRAQGKNAEADAQEFANRQKREFEDAVKAGKSPEYLAKLAEAQAAERARWNIEHATATGVAGTMAGADAAGATAASSSASTMTVTQADRLLMEVSTIRLLLSQMLDLSRSGLRAPEFSGSGTYVRNTTSVQLHFHAPVAASMSDLQGFGRIVGDEVNRALGQSILNRRRLNGDVTA